MNNYQRDGFMRFDNNGAGRPNYYPNSFGGPESEPSAAEPHYHWISEKNNFRVFQCIFKNLLSQVNPKNIMQFGHLKSLQF